MRMIRHLFTATVLAFAIPSLVTSIEAQSRPKDTTGQCKDGTYTKAQTKRGACSQHGGVVTWFADEEKPAPKSNAPAAKEQPKDSGKPTAQAGKPTGDRPKDATAKCKDGTYSYAKQHRGACSHHGGVAEWYK